MKEERMKGMSDRGRKERRTEERKVMKDRKSWRMIKREILRRWDGEEREE